VGISLWLFGACADDPPPPQAKAEPAPATLAPPAAAAPPVDDVVHEVTLASTPSGAKVLLSGAEIGTTPHPLRFKRATTVQITADGYLPAEVTVDATSDPNVITQLQPDPAAAGVTGGEAAPLAGGAKTASADPKAAADPKASASPKAKAGDPPTASPSTPSPSTPTPTPSPSPSSSLPYPNVTAAKSDYQAGRIDRDAYDQAVRKLKLRRTEKINAIKAKYQAGEFDKDEYNRRKRIIDNEYKGT
jgi:hypothetical protein